MSKKKFTAGLESLFGKPSEDNFGEDSPLLTSERKRSSSNRVKKTPKTKRRSISKNFTSDLDSLFEDAMQESMAEKKEKLTRGLDEHSRSIKKRTRRPLSGLDALIRSTAENTLPDEEVDTIIRKVLTKRVTFVCNKEKLERLKKIAKKERAYLKDILSGLINEYIQEYEAKKKGMN